jgi:adenosylcobinamide-phosphate synthase
MTIALLALIAGFMLDLVLGDPYCFPHPIKLFGSCIKQAEKWLNKGSYLRTKGAIMVLALVAGVWGIFYLLIQLTAVNFALSVITQSIFVYYGLANHCLIKEALKVNRKLEKSGIEAARHQLSFIVGRDTSQLSANKIRASVLETLSENLSDGVVAPLFYYALGGIPAMFAYKMINTLDSMIGYKTDRYKRFGCFAARLDDVANFIPARITALLMVAITLSWRGLYFIFLYGHKHASPNSGYPEAALAGILNCKLGGPNTYFGKVVDKPYLGHREREITASDIYKACLVNFFVSVLAILLIVVLSATAPW